MREKTIEVLEDVLIIENQIFADQHQLLTNYKLAVSCLPIFLTHKNKQTQLTKINVWQVHTYIYTFKFLLIKCDRFWSSLLLFVVFATRSSKCKIQLYTYIYVYATINENMISTHVYARVPIVVRPASDWIDIRRWGQKFALLLFFALFAS